MARRITRKSMKQDEFVEAAFDAGEWLEENWRIVVIALAGVGARTGQLHHTESRILFNLLRFESLRVTDIMTPRTVVLAAAEEMTLQAFHDANPHLRFSRIPTYHQDEKDRVTGYFLKDALLASLLEYLLLALDKVLRNLHLLRERRL